MYDVISSDRTYKQTNRKTEITTLYIYIRWNQALPRNQEVSLLRFEFLNHAKNIPMVLPKLFLIKV